MKIRRSGSSSNHGLSEINLAGSSVRWDELTECIILKSGSVMDFNGNSNHDYEISFNKEDFNQIIGAISNISSDVGYKKAEVYLDGSHKYLSRLTFVASGFFPKIDDAGSGFQLNISNVK